MSRISSKNFYKELGHSWVKNSQFCDILAPDLLKLGLSHREQRPKGLGAPFTWVFDLDSTLFCVSNRIRAIYYEFLRQHPRPPQHWHWLLEHLKPESHQYGIESTFRSVFKELDSAKAAEWASELWQAFQETWNEGFFSNRFLHLDYPYQGASDFVHQVHKEGFDIVYLTGRDRPRTGEGTLRSLRMHGFPLSQSTHLFMKPQKETSDLEFKKEVTRILRSRFQVTMSIDNEPENLIMFAEEFPESEIVFFHSIMSPRIPLKLFHQVLGERKPWRLNSYTAEGPPKISL